MFETNPDIQKLLILIAIFHANMFPSDDFNFGCFETGRAVKLKYHEIRYPSGWSPAFGGRHPDGNLASGCHKFLPDAYLD